MVRNNVTPTPVMLREEVCFHETSCLSASNVGSKLNGDRSTAYPGERRNMESISSLTPIFGAACCLLN